MIKDWAVQDVDDAMRKNGGDIDGEIGWMDQVQSLYLVRWDLEGGQQEERKVIKVIKATLEKSFFFQNLAAEPVKEAHPPSPYNAAFVT